IRLTDGRVRLCVVLFDFRSPNDDPNTRAHDLTFEKNMEKGPILTEIRGEKYDFIDRMSCKR
ncbi:MAG: hypothetical protein GY820_23735, partial [Gammaproteobacteria bacterium]|nr:hypothetical protein [Gammaproteobacteria bacterium]